MLFLLIDSINYLLLHYHFLYCWWLSSVKEVRLPCNWSLWLNCIAFNGRSRSESLSGGRNLLRIMLLTIQLLNGNNLRCLGGSSIRWKLPQGLRQKGCLYLKLRWRRWVFKSWSLQISLLKIFYRLGKLGAILNGVYSSMLKLFSFALSVNSCLSNLRSLVCASYRIKVYLILFDDWRRQDLWLNLLSLPNVIIKSVCWLNDLFQNASFLKLLFFIYILNGILCVMSGFLLKWILVILRFAWYRIEC